MTTFEKMRNNKRISDEERADAIAMLERNIERMEKRGLPESAIAHSRDALERVQTYKPVKQFIRDKDDIRRSMDTCDKMVELCWQRNEWLQCARWLADKDEYAKELRAAMFGEAYEPQLLTAERPVMDDGASEFTTQIGGLI